MKMNLAEITPYEQNAKKHTKKQIDQIARSIKEFGFNQPLVIDKNNEIVVGHGRYYAAQQLGLQDVPVIKLENLTDEQVDGYRLADNRLNESEWDMSLVIEQLKHLDTTGFDITLIGFDRDLLIESDEKDDQIPDNSPPVAKLGDLWALGRHKLLCGDSTDKEAVARLMGDSKADLLLTDPPYGIDLDTDYSGMPSRWNNKEMYQGKYKKVEGDNKKFDASYLISMAKEVFLFGADYYANTLPDSGINGTWYCWDKREDDDGGSFDKMLGSPFELCWSKNKRGKKFIRMRWASFLHSDATEGEQSKGRVHPTQKPIALMNWFINKFSKEDDIVLDLFGGSGSTLIACEKTNRICYMSEIDPKYTDVIINRWEQYTGQKAEKLE